MPNNNQKTTIIQTLRKSFDFVSELTPEQLDLLATHSIIEKVPAGTIIAEQMGGCRGFALIISGEMRLSKHSEDGREIALLRIGERKACPLSAACVLGGDEAYPVRVTVSVDSTIIWVARESLREVMMECEPFWRYIFNGIAERLYDTIDVIGNVAFTPIKKRLAQHLLSESNYGKHPVYITHDLLAREIGTVREVVSRELKHLEKADILILSRGRITVKNPDALVALVNHHDEK